MARLSGLLGLLLLLGIAIALSSNRKAIRWNTVLWGLALQLGCALVVLKGDWFAQGLAWLPVSLPFLVAFLLLQLVLLRLFSRQLAALNSSLPGRILGLIGLEFLIGLLKFNLIARFFAFMREVVHRLISYSAEGSEFVFGALSSERGEKSIGFVFAFQVLPTIIFVASIFAILYYVGVMQAVVRRVSRVMSRFMGSSGA